jgi:acyl carrier protein
VEHSLVARLGQWAIKDGKEFVEFTYSPTEKNVLALEFITSIGEQYRNETNTSWTFPAERLAVVEYDPDGKTPIGREEPAARNPEKLTPRPGSAFGSAHRSERLQKIGENLYDVRQLSKAIDDYRRRGQPSHAAAHVTPGSALEATLANIWRKVLGRPRIGMNDNFFEVGGTSLRAVQVIAMIKKELNQTLSIVSLFECPTVTLLAAKLSAASGEAQGETTVAVAAQRGQQRRYNTMRRKAS